MNDGMNRDGSTTNKNSRNDDLHVHVHLDPGLAEPGLHRGERCGSGSARLP